MCRFLLVFVFVMTVTTLLGQTVYKTPSGKKYHTATCHYVKNVSQKLTVDKARQIGLSPCTQCLPTQKGSTATPRPELGIKPGEAQGERVSSVRCKGTTKAGARCKRMTKNVNGYCFQHESN